jgi:hypothetical protein
MKPHSAGSAELSRRKSNSKPLLDNNTYTQFEHNDYMDDEDAIPGGFDHHPLRWAGSHPQDSTKPLIDHCTNEWKEKPYYRGRVVRLLSRLPWIAKDSPMGLVHYNTRHLPIVPIFYYKTSDRGRSHAHGIPPTAGSSGIWEALWRRLRQ